MGRNLAFADYVTALGWLVGIAVGIVIIALGTFRLFSGIVMAKADRQRILQLVVALEEVLPVVRRIEAAAIVVADDLRLSHERADLVEGTAGEAADAASRSPEAAL